MRNIIKVVFVIIATLIGAGFASGREIFSLFFAYGLEGIFGIIISSFIISFVVFKVLFLCNKNNINTYDEFCKYVGNKNNKLNLGNFLNNIVNIILLITYFIMISGFSSLLKQELNINRIFGSIIIAFLCCIILRKSVDGIIKVSNFLIPILIIFILFISLKNLNFFENYKNIFSVLEVQKNKGIIKSILYACYNSIILIPVLIPINKFIKNKKESLITAVFTFIIIIILSLSIYNLLLLGNVNIFLLEMPIVEIMNKYGSIYKIIYIILIGISIFTTAVSAGFGYLQNYEKNKKEFKNKLIFISILGIFISQISFSFLVNLLYPVLGLIGILEIGLICII